MLKKFYEWMFVYSPWVFLAGMLQFHFQQFVPFNRLFMGANFFDYVTVTDFLVILIFFVFAYGFSKKAIVWNGNRLGRPLQAAIFLLVLAGILQIAFQEVFEPVLVTPTEYFRSMFIFPLIYMVLAYKTLDSRTFNRMLQSYVLMVVFFCVMALFQYFTGLFPGEKHDFMGRLVWPFVDFVSMKSTSANWAAFFVTPAFILSFIHVWKKRDLKIFVPALILSAIVIYMTQSYGAYAAAFTGITFYLFRELKFKKFLAVFVLILIAAGGIYLAQINTKKFQVSYGDAEYRYSNSVDSRKDIYAMNWHILLTRPIMGVGMNQYQSYFAANHKEVLGRDYGEVQFPPHAHNFLVSIWTSLGGLGLIAMIILIIDLLWRHRLKPEYPAVFALIAIMTHGLVDSYYWRQEIAYIFWMTVLFTYLLNMSATLHQES